MGGYLTSVTCYSFGTDFQLEMSGSSIWSDELLAEAVEKCADINSLVMIKGRQLSQLMVASYHGNIDYVEDLLNVPGVTVDLQNNEGQHALLYACVQGHTEIAQLILNTCQHPKDVVNLSDKMRRTPLMAVSYFGHRDTVSVLLESAAQVNVQNSKGWSSLMLSCLHRHTQTVSLLLQYGAHVNMPNNDGCPPLMVASHNGHTETVSILLKNGAHVNIQSGKGNFPLMVASQNGHAETVSILLQNGAHGNMQNNNGWPPLMIASQNGHTETVSILLQNGAHVNIQSGKGNFPLMVASQNGHAETVSILLQNGAHVNMQNNDGWSPLMIASQNRRTETVSILLQNGAHVNMESGKGNFPLMVASQNGHAETVSILLQNGAHGNVQTTALHFISKYNQISIAKLIIREKTQAIDVQDSLGRTPLMIASSCGHPEMVNLLLEAGAQVNFSNFSDYPSLHLPPHQISMPEEVSTVRGSALDIAVITGHVEVVSLLLQHGAKIRNIYYLLRSIALRLSRMQCSFRQMSRKSTDWEKYSAVIRLLFSCNSDLIGRVQCTNPSTLYMACAFGILQMVSLLTELGIDASDLYRPDDSGSSYWCNLIRVISSGSLLSETTSKQASSEVISLLHRENWPKIIRLLTDNGLDVNHQDSTGSFALGIASREGHTDLVRLLLQRESGVDLRDGEGISSLMEATSGGHLEICRLLLHYRAKVDMLDSKGWSALMVAVAADNVDFILILLERGAQINLQDESGTSSLMLSCLAGYTRVTKVLLGHGAEVNLQNGDGITALMMSCYNGHTEVAKLLINSGADISIVTSIGMTALRVSTDNSHKDITKLLIEYGAGDHLYTNPSRKRPLSMRDIPFISPGIVAHVHDKLEARLNQIENILQTLLQLQGTQHVPTVSNKLRKVELKPTLRDSLRILLPIAHDWKTIGTLLGVELHSLETIKRDNI